MSKTINIKIINHTNYNNKTVFKDEILKNVSKSEAIALINDGKAIEYVEEIQGGGSKDEQTIDQKLSNINKDILIEIAKDFDLELSSKDKKDFIITELLSAGIDEEYLEAMKD